MQYQKKELFEGYEIKNWVVSPRLYKIFGGAAIFNVLAIFVVGQAGLFTTRGCDSPLVGNFCQVLDTIYLGGSLLSSDTEFVSKDYQKTEIENADITYIDVSGAAPPLEYPAGYFALANPSDFTAMQSPDMYGNFPALPPPNMNGLSGFSTVPPSTNNSDLLAQPQVTPTPNSNAVIGQTPDEPFSFEETPIKGNPIPQPKNNNRAAVVRRYPFEKSKRKNALPKPPVNDEELTAKKEKPNEKKAEDEQAPIKSDAVSEVEINRKAFEDLGDSVNDKIEKKEIDLNKSFTVVMDGTLTADGKLDRKKSKFIKFDGDQQMIDVAKQAIEAVGDSGFLGHLKNNGVDKVNFTLVQDEKQIYAIIVSDQKTPEKAGSIASLLNTALSGLIFADKNGLKTLDESSKVLVTNSKVTSEGKKFILNFALPKDIGQDLINRTLKGRAEKKAKQQINSTAQNDNTNQKTVK